jgi:RNA polymerase sigma-32 factor
VSSRPKKSEKQAPVLPAPRPEGAVERRPELPDALTKYLAELGQHPPISREEEHELAVRWVEESDLDAARQLVLSNLRLVVKIAMEYRRAWTNVLDLIQEGNVGLMQAVRRYDPYQGVKLSSYAVYWIRAYILKYILDNFRVVRLGTTRAQRKLFFRLNREKRELERQGFEASPPLLAERLEVSEADVVDMEQRLAKSDLSVDADEELRRVFMGKVKEFASGLGERERRIVDERILAEEPRTLQELGDEFGVSRERVRQLEARVVSQLRTFLSENLVDFEYYAPSSD